MLPGLSAAGMIGAAETFEPPVFMGATSILGGEGTLPKPSGAQAGDLLVLYMNGTDNPSTWTAPEFTWRSGNGNFGNSRMVVLTRKLDGSEGSGFSIGGTFRVVAALLYRGGRAGFDVTAPPGQVTGATQSTPSITATRNGVLLAGFGLRGAGASIVTPPAGMTQRVLLTDSSFSLKLAVYDLNPSPPGATGAKSITWNGSYAGAAGPMQIY